VYLEQAPVYEELAANLDWERAYRQEQARRRRQQPVVQALSSRLKALRRGGGKRGRCLGLVRQYIPSGRILDVGCGDGTLLRSLGDQYVPYGIEVSRSLAAQAEAAIAGRDGRLVHSDALSGAREFADGFFSGIVMYMYLEHELNPAAILAESRRLLTEQGRLILYVPNYASLHRRLRGANWCGFRFPEHVNYFTPDSLQAMCGEAGLRLLRCGFSDRQPWSNSFLAVFARA